MVTSFLKQLAGILVFIIYFAQYLHSKHFLLQFQVFPQNEMQLNLIIIIQLTAESITNSASLLIRKNLRDH